MKCTELRYSCRTLAPISWDEMKQRHVDPASCRLVMLCLGRGQQELYSLPQEYCYAVFQGNSS